jgi:hypothetical protein
MEAAIAAEHPTFESCHSILNFPPDGQVCSGSGH